MFVTMFTVLSKINTYIKVIFNINDVSADVSTLIWSLVPVTTLKILIYIFIQNARD